MNTKNNQRFRDTDLKIQKVLLDVMEDTGFDQITVQSLCKKAAINRSTFYAHYFDVFDLLDKTEHEMSQRLVEQYRKRNISERNVFSPKYLWLFLGHIKQHKQFYKICLQNQKSFPIKRGFEPLWNTIVRPSCQREGITSEDEIMYYFVYFQAGLTMVLKRWIETDCKQTPDELAKIMAHCLPDLTIDI